MGSVHLYGRRLVLEWAEEEGVEDIRKRTAAHFDDSTHKSNKKAKAVFNMENTNQDVDDDDE